MSYQLHSEVGGDSACKGKDAWDEVMMVVTVIMMMVAMMMIKVMMIKIIMMNKLPMSDVVDDTIQKIIALKRIHRKKSQR
jgi:hypothetical protein